jgi:hypothetical protein
MSDSRLCKQRATCPTLRDGFCVFRNKESNDEMPKQSFNMALDEMLPLTVAVRVTCTHKRRRLYVRRTCSRRPPQQWRKMRASTKSSHGWNGRRRKHVASRKNRAGGEFSNRSAKRKRTRPQIEKCSGRGPKWRRSKPWASFKTATSKKVHVLGILSPCFHLQLPRKGRI